jgi:GNAT superfamily N-acetyltransferase
VDIRLAEEEEIEGLMQLVGDCIAGMRDAGIDQWDDVYPDRRTLLSDAGGRTLFVATEGAAVVGMIVVNDYQNPEYGGVPWTLAGTRVAVVHRLMVHPRFQRKGIARELMRFAERRARELGYDVVRLDAFSKNPAALQLYHGTGYHDAGQVTFRKGVFRCFEKRLEGT